MKPGLQAFLPWLGIGAGLMVILFAGEILECGNPLELMLAILAAGVAGIVPAGIAFGVRELSRKRPACPKCGRVAAGAFCAHCGTKLA